MHHDTERFVLPLLAFAAMVIGCSDADSQNHANAGKAQPPQPLPVDRAFSDYWYQGKAEVTRYALEQARYGEIRKGDAVLVFVTEDFLGDKQVKLESDPTGRDVVPILKLNLTKKFVTGVYPYSLMTSVFTPVDVSTKPHSLKVTTTAQEWCGHTFTQLNFRASKYDVELRSYFEKEGDRDFALEPAFLEDEVWTRIRLAPATLPVGDVRIIPGTMAQRLRHTELQVINATATLAAVPGSPQLMRYTLSYPDPVRTLAIDFEKEFPHRIMGWTETYRDGFGPKATTLTTRATRTNELKLDYWTKNSSADTLLRKELGLTVQ